MPVSVKTYWAPDPILVAQELRAVADTLMSFEEPLLAAREVIIRDIRSNFETESDPSGSGWAEWSPSYAPYAQKHNTGILQQTGNMMRAVTSRKTWQVSSHEIFADTALWEVPNKKGKSNPRWDWHQGGATRAVFNEETRAVLAEMGHDFAENELPARPFLGVSREAEEIEIYDILDEFVDGAFAVAVHPTTGVAQRRLPGGRFGKGF